MMKKKNKKQKKTNRHAFIYNKLPGKATTIPILSFLFKNKTKKNSILTK